VLPGPPAFALRPRRDIIATTWASRYLAGQDINMPSLFRFLLILAVLTGLVFAGLYVLATRFEPEQQTISKPVPGIKIRKEQKPSTAPSPAP
jgi:hypothetical protein